MNELSKIKFKITGLRPLLLHNGSLADRKYVYTQKISEILKKGGRKMTDANHDERDRLEWEGSLYWSTEIGGIVMPSDNIERMLQLGAQKAKKGKDVNAAAFMVETEAEVVHRLSGKTMNQIRAVEGYTMRKGVSINGSRVMRIRPMIHVGWTITFTIEFDASIVNQSDIVNAVIQGGKLIGLGDWRPKFGRFATEVL